MLSWLGGLFKTRTAVQAGRANPILERTVSKSSAIHKEIPLRKFVGTDTQDALSRQLFLDINEICNAVNPIAACRERLAACMMKFAAYQVLVIPPAPEKDISGLRGQPGITGNLREHLVRIIESNHELRSDMHEPSSPLTQEAAWEYVRRSYWRWYWFLETFNAARIELGDYRQQNDWYLPFKHAACATCEITYRRELDLPSAFDNSVARDAGMAYPIFTDIVLAGDKFPDDAWREYHKSSNIPMPVFDTQSTN